MTYGQVVGTIVLTLLAALTSLGAIAAIIFIAKELCKYMHEEQI